jgi:CheY-like chemotaxis protein
VRLPVAEAPAGAMANAAPSGPNAAPLRVLVVDDNVDAADSLGVMLELHGHAVAVAHGGPAALEVAGRFAPDVVLLDIGMPGMNGYEVAERLRRDEAGDGRRLLLVALTGWGADEDKRRAMAAGFDHHLTKPVDPAGLDAVLEAGAGRWLV